MKDELITRFKNYCNSPDRSIPIKGIFESDDADGKIRLQSGEPPRIIAWFTISYWQRTGVSTPKEEFDLTKEEYDELVNLFSGAIKNIAAKKETNTLF